MKRVFALLMVLGLLLAVAGCDRGEKATTGSSVKQRVVRLGIIQIVEHPALDDARKGFLDVLSENGYKDGQNLKVDYQNAQNEQANLQTIARKFKQDKCDLVLAVATSSAVAMANETADIPILITAVTDPVSAKLVNSLEKPGTNVSGTSDMNPVADQLALIKRFVPGAKKVGIIYNSSEINSLVQVKIAEQNAGRLGLQLRKVTVTASSEVTQAAQSLVGRVDAIYLPTDNMVISALSTVLKVCEEKKLPLFVGDANAVENGAIATVGIDYYQLGRTTGEMALDVLAGKKPQDMAILSQEGKNLVINPGAAERMGIKVPDALLQEAEKVIR